MKINDKNKLFKYMFLYRSFLFKFTKFETNSKDIELLKILELLNIKSRYKRIYTTINEICDYIDNYYNGENICNFKNNKCICHRTKKLDYINGCCRKCFYISNNGCTTKNFACKMFNCKYVKDKYKVLEYKDINLLKVLTPFQRLTLKSDYFRTVEDVSMDLYVGPFISLFRIIYSNIKREIHFRRK